MYLIYLDESGTPHQNDSDPYYLLAGLVVSERDWSQIDVGVEEIKNSYGMTEIRTATIFKRFQKHSNMRNFQLLGDIYSLIARSPITLICTGVYKPKNHDLDIEFNSWVFMLERLNIIVDKLCQRDRVDEYGLIIMDEKNDEKDLRIKNNLRLMRQQDITKQHINRIIEDPVFTPSHWRNLVQLSDSISYCCKKYLENDDFFVSQFLTIQDKFSKSLKGKIMGYGFKIWK